MALAILDLCRDKLYTQMASPDVHLRILVGHSNLLESLAKEINESPEYYRYDAYSHALDGVGATDLKFEDLPEHIVALEAIKDASPVGEDITRFFPTSDARFSRYLGEDGNGDAGRDSNVNADTNTDVDEDEDENGDPVFSSCPPPRILTVRNPDPDPEPQSQLQLQLHSNVGPYAVKNTPSTARSSPALHVLETILEDDNTGPLGPTSAPGILQKPSTHCASPSPLSVPKRPALNMNSNISVKRPLLTAMKEAWWGGDSVPPLLRV
ncbi:hypothetical protein BJX64DRAFT_252178 [Aspergillus heterothallicus]